MINEPSEFVAHAKALGAIGVGEHLHLHYAGRPLYVSHIGAREGIEKYLYGEWVSHRNLKAAYESFILQTNAKISEIGADARTPYERGIGTLFYVEDGKAVERHGYGYRKQLNSRGDLATVFKRIGDLKPLVALPEESGLYTCLMFEVGRELYLRFGQNSRQDYDDIAFAFVKDMDLSTQDALEIIERRKTRGGSLARVNLEEKTIAFSRQSKAFGKIDGSKATKLVEKLGLGACVI